MASWKNTSGKADSEVREADAVFLWVTFHYYSDERCSTALLWLHVACSQVCSVHTGQSDNGELEIFSLMLHN